VFVRGANTGIEFKRDENSFFRGIVVKNWDPRKLYRVKIYIPEISNQPLKDWLQKYKQLDFRFPGKNNKQDVWNDTAIFEEISKFLPYAEPCFPLLGENSPARYQSPAQLAVVTDSDYEEGFEVNNEKPQTLDSGAFGPSFWYENFETNTGDAFVKPAENGNYTAKNNPYSFQYRPSNQVDKPKGVFCVPSVGSQVWCFHYRGDVNYPVYIGGRHDFRGNALITDSDAPQEPSESGQGTGGATEEAKSGIDDTETRQSLDYPGVFENYKTTESEVISPGFEDSGQPAGDSN